MPLKIWRPCHLKWTSIQTKNNIKSYVEFHLSSFSCWDKCVILLDTHEARALRHTLYSLPIVHCTCSTPTYSGRDIQRVQPPRDNKAEPITVLWNSWKIRALRLSRTRTNQPTWKAFYDDGIESPSWSIGPRRLVMRLSLLCLSVNSHDDRYRSLLAGVWQAWEGQHIDVGRSTHCLETTEIEIGKWTGTWHDTDKPMLLELENRLNECDLPDVQDIANLTIVSWRISRRARTWLEECSWLRNLTMWDLLDLCLAWQIAFRSALISCTCNIEVTNYQNKR